MLQNVKWGVGGRIEVHSGVSAPLTAPLLSALNVLQEKWALHLFKALLDGPSGFNELARRVPGGINTTTLADRLSRFEDLGLLTRTVHGGLPPRTTYDLTEKGRGLEEVKHAITIWALTAFDPVRAGAPPEALPPGVARVSGAIDLLQERWTLHVVRALLNGPLGFGEVAGAVPGLATSSLARRLTRMEEVGLVTREAPSGFPPRTRYTLTGSGEPLRAVLSAIDRWANTHFEAPSEETQQFAQ